jgi:hypothetical protein
MMAQKAANGAALVTADAFKRTQRVLESQLPLLEQWRELQVHADCNITVLTKPCGFVL